MTNQYTPLTPEDWVAQGYKKFESNLYLNAEFGLQKCLEDEIGKRYFITVWVYDSNKLSYNVEGASRWAFQPETQFFINDTTFDMRLHHSNSEIYGIMSIDEVENFFHNAWTAMDCDYYETWEH